MTSIASVTALAILRPITGPQDQGAPGLLASPVSAPTVFQPAGYADAAQGKLAHDFFSVTYRDVNQIKMQIFERVGEKFGINMDDFEDAGDYARAIRSEFGKLKMDENSDAIIKEIEKELGLDKLGVSLEEVINAIDNADGEDNRKLSQAIEASYGIENDANASGGNAPSKGQLKIDEIGLYSVS